MKKNQVGRLTLGGFKNYFEGMVIKTWQCSHKGECFFRTSECSQVTSYTREFRKPHAWPGQHAHSSKTREDPELSFLAGLSAQTKLEVKAKIELRELSWLSVRVPTRSQSRKGGEMEFLFA